MLMLTSRSRLDQVRNRVRRSEDVLNMAKKGTSDETAQNGPDMEEAAFGKNFSNLRRNLAVVAVWEIVIY